MKKVICMDGPAKGRVYALSDNVNSFEILEYDGPVRLEPGLVPPSASVCRYNIVGQIVDWNFAYTFPVRRDPLSELIEHFSNINSEDRDEIRRG